MATAPFENITSLEDMCNYIKLKLGMPVINVEVKNIQIYQEIFDAAQEFYNYGYDISSYRDYVILTTSAGIDEYSLSGQDIVDIVDFDFSFGIDGINTLFSPTHTLLYKDWVVRGNYPGGPGSQSMVLTDWYIGMNYLEEVKNTFGKRYTCYWRPLSQTVKVIPTPQENMVGALIIFRKEKIANLYNHILFKKLCIAKVKKLWGSILDKNEMNFPGGGRVNGAKIEQQGIDEEEKVLDRIRAEAPPIDIIVG